MYRSGSRQMPRVIAGQGLRQTSSPISPRTTRRSASTTSTAIPSEGSPDGALLDRDRRRRGEEARADLRPARDVDDRPAALADDGREPAIRLRIPRLAARGEDPQSGEVVRCGPAPRRAASGRGRASARRRGPRRGGARTGPRAGRAARSRALRGDDRRPVRRRPRPSFPSRSSSRGRSPSTGGRRGPTSVWKAHSSPIFTSRPAVACTTPFGRPVVPDV